MADMTTRETDLGPGAASVAMKMAVAMKGTARSNASLTSSSGIKTKKSIIVKFGWILLVKNRDNIQNLVLINSFQHYDVVRYCWVQVQSSVRMMKNFHRLHLNAWIQGGHPFPPPYIGPKWDLLELKRTVWLFRRMRFFTTTKIIILWTDQESVDSNITAQSLRISERM